MENINKEKIEKLKKEKKTFIVQYSAKWCGPCRTLTPILESICYGHEAQVYKFDIEKDPGYAKELGISSIPFVQFFKEGDVFASRVGFAPRDYYEEQIGIIKG